MGDGRVFSASKRIVVSDTDGVGDPCDNCPGDPNYEQADGDTDAALEIVDDYMLLKKIYKRGFSIRMFRGPRLRGRWAYDEAANVFVQDSQKKLNPFEFSF